MSVGRRVAIQSVTATILVGTEWHCITTVDCLSVRLSLGSDGKPHLLWAGGPSWGGDDSTWAGWPLAVRCTTIQPILRVAARSVGWAQSDSVSTVNDGISVTFESENKIMFSYFTGSVFSKGWGCNEDENTDLKLHWISLFSCLDSWLSRNEQVSNSWGRHCTLAYQC